MNYFRNAKENAPTREERLRRLEEESLRREEEALRQEEAARLAALAQAKTLQNLITPDKIGHSIGDKGIYFGLWVPKDRNSQSLGKIFHVFAAPKDLYKTNSKGAGTRTFSEAAREVGALKSWNGHNGIYLENDTALYTALKNGSAIGKWFIPTRDLLYGEDIDGNEVRPQHLYGLQNKGDFKRTFTTEDNAPSPQCPDWYWSCTEDRDHSMLVWNVRFSDGVDGGDLKDYLRMSCRPCRAELAPQLRPTPRVF